MPADNNTTVKSEDRRVSLSVIVLIYNVERYLRRALDSLKSQAMEDAEFILIDDCSTDSSGSIALEYVRSDSRFRYIRHEKNMSALMGRKHGVLVSRGDHIMFLDGDDYYSPGFCEIAYERAVKEDADILNFEMEMFSSSENKSSVIARNNDIKLYPGKISGDGYRMLECHLAKNLWRGHLCSKVFRRGPLLAAVKHAIDAYMNVGEDAYLFFLTSFFSRSYAGMNVIGYHYDVGTGNSTARYMELGKLRNYCDLAQSVGALKEFLDAQGAEEKYYGFIDIYRSRHIQEACTACLELLPPDQLGTGFKMLEEAWGARDVIAAVYMYNGSDVSFVNGSMPEALRNDEQRKIRSIGLMMPDQCGVEEARTALDLLHMTASMGCSLTVITGENDCGAYAFLPDHVRKASIPGCAMKNIVPRLDGLKAALEGIDLLIYCGGEDPIAVYDILFARSLSVKTVLSVRSAGIFTMSRLGRMPLALITAARSADCVVVHGNMNREFLGAFNGNTVYINERIDPERLESTPLSSPGGNDILLFVSNDIAGSADDMTALVKTLLVQSRDTRIIVIGDHSGSYSRALGGEQSVKSHPGRVIFAEGGVSEYWESAAVTVYPDETDGLPEILIESGAHGVPVVTYGLPYSELRREFRSIINVPGRDTLSMASEILKLIGDRERASELGKAFRAELIEFAKAPVEDKWRELISTLESGRSSSPANEPSTLLIKTIVSQYELAVSKIDDDTIHGALYTFAHLNSAIDGKPAYCQVYDGQKDARVVSFRVASISSATGETTDSYDVFQLPAVEPDMPKSRFDRILTTRDAVKVSEGGTGAPNARDALRNLGAYPLINSEALSPGTGLDECVQAGAYSCEKRDKEYESGIFPVKGAFKLVVEQLTGGVAKQTAISAESGELFFRTGRNGIWNSWQHFAIAENTYLAIEEALHKMDDLGFADPQPEQARGAELDRFEAMLRSLTDELIRTREAIANANKKRHEAIKARDARIAELEGALAQTRNIWLLRLLRKISRIIHGK